MKNSKFIGKYNINQNAEDKKKVKLRHMGINKSSNIYLGRILKGENCVVSFLSKKYEARNEDLMGKMFWVKKRVLESDRSRFESCSLPSLAP